MTSISSAGMKWDDTSSQWTFTLPKSTPNGQYLLRFEHIALHSASSAGGAQFYISCAQINVTGGGSGSPSPQVSLPGAYTPTQPNIMINIYYPLVSKMTPEMGGYVFLGDCFANILGSQPRTPFPAQPSGAVRSRWCNRCWRLKRNRTRDRWKHIVAYCIYIQNNYISQN